MLRFPITCSVILSLGCAVAVEQDDSAMVQTNINLAKDKKVTGNLGGGLVVDKAIDCNGNCALGATSWCSCSSCRDEWDNKGTITTGCESWQSGELVDGRKNGPSEWQTQPHSGGTQGGILSCYDTAWAQVDLGVLMLIDTVKLHSFGDRGFCNRRVAISRNGVSWDHKADSKLTDAPKATPQVWTFETDIARFVRVTSSQSNLNTGTFFVELEVFKNNANQRTGYAQMGDYRTEILTEEEGQVCGAALEDVNQYHSQFLMERNGWRFNGQGNDFEKMTVSRTLLGSSSITIDFGAVSGTVSLKLNDELKLRHKGSSEVETFTYQHGDILAIEAESDSQWVIHSISFACYDEAVHWTHISNDALLGGYGTIGQKDRVMSWGNGAYTAPMITADSFAFGIKFKLSGHAQYLVGLTSQPAHKILDVVDEGDKAAHMDFPMYASSSDKTIYYGAGHADKTEMDYADEVGSYEISLNENRREVNFYHNDELVHTMRGSITFPLRVAVSMGEGSAYDFEWVTPPPTPAPPTPAPTPPTPYPPPPAPVFDDSHPDGAVIGLGGVIDFMVKDAYQFTSNEASQAELVTALTAVFDVGLFPIVLKEFKIGVDGAWTAFGARELVLKTILSRSSEGEEVAIKYEVVCDDATAEYVKDTIENLVPAEVMEALGTHSTLMDGAANPIVLEVLSIGAPGLRKSAEPAEEAADADADLEGKSADGEEKDGKQPKKKTTKTKKKKQLCFPGDAVVEVSGRGDVRLSELEAGDRVLTKHDGSHEEVLGFLHSIRSQPTEFLTVVLSTGEFRASASHIVFANDVDMSLANVQVGDHLSVADEKALVLALRRSIASEGMFAPLTSSGTVVVDGVYASNYAGSSASLSLPHSTCHELAFPLRVYHKLQDAFAFFSTDLQEKASVPVVGLLSDLQSWVA